MFLARLGRTFAPFGANGGDRAHRARTHHSSSRWTATPSCRTSGPSRSACAWTAACRTRRPPTPSSCCSVIEPSAPYQSRLLDQDDGGRWGTTLAADDVLDGFWYKVAGGDAETKEYRVQPDAASPISRRSTSSGRTGPREGDADWSARSRRCAARRSMSRSTPIAS